VTTSETETVSASPLKAGFWERFRSDWRYPMGAIIALALVPRMVYLAQIAHWPFFYHPILDSRTQYQWGATLVRTWGLGTPEVLAKPPLYAYYLALNQVAFGEGPPSMFAARFIQLVLSAVTCGMTYLVGRRAFGSAAGVIAGLIAALYSPGVFNDGELLDTALASFLATGFLLAVLSALEQPRRGRWLWCGLLLGALGLMRGNMLLLLVWAAVLLAVVVRRSLPRAQIARLVGMLALGVVIPIAPITLRNYAITHSFVPIANNGGINFYTGNNPQADGYSPIASGIAWERTWYVMIKAHMLDRADAYWIQQGLEFWRQHPGQALALLAKKAYLYWNAYEIPNNLSYDWGREHASVLRLLPFTFVVVGALALAGMVLGGWRDWRAFSLRSRSGCFGEVGRALTTFLLAQMVAVIIFFVCDRYRMPAVPVMCVFAGFWLAEVGKALSGWQRRGAVGRATPGGLRMAASAALVLVLAAAFVGSDLYGVRRARGANRDWYYLGQAYYNGKQYPQAKEALLKAVKADPRDADAYRFLGNLSQEMGEDEAAVPCLQRSLEIAPDYGEVAATLAGIVLSHDLPIEPTATLVARAAAAQFVNVPVLSALVRVEIRQGKMEKARADLGRAAEALKHTNPLDSRRSAQEAAYRQAAEEAQAAGLTIPEVHLYYGSGPAPGTDTSGRLTEK